MERCEAWPLACLLGLALVAPAQSGPAIHLIETERVVLRVRPLTASMVGDAREVTLELDDTTVGEAELGLRWPDPQTPSRLRLRASLRTAPLGFDRLVHLESELVEAGGRTTRATRDLALRDNTAPTTILFEVARTASGPLTLAVAAEVTTQMTLSAHPVVGPPVQFLLEIQWLENGSSTSLETNQLHTFVGQSVSYSFRLGLPGEAESGSLRLLPVELVGDTLRVEVEMSGTLPNGEGGVAIISRTEQWLSSSGATSSLDLKTGDPPRGFRFRVTSRF